MRGPLALAFWGVLGFFGTVICAGTALFGLLCPKVDLLGVIDLLLVLGVALGSS